MKIDKVSYQKVFPIAAYVNERIGFEASLEDGESPGDAIEKLRELANAAHKPLQEGDSYTVDKTNGHTHNFTQEGIEEIPPSKEDRVTSLIKQINSCKELKVLESYRLIAAADTKLQEAYYEKREELVSELDNQR